VNTALAQGLNDTLAAAKQDLFGVGIDLVRTGRMQRIWERSGTGPSQMILMEDEQREFVRASDPVRFLASRFAAKEAIVKAMGTGFANGIWFQDVGSVTDDRGSLRIIYSDRGEQKRLNLGIEDAFVTIDECDGYFFACVLLTKSQQDPA